MSLGTNQQWDDMAAKRPKVPYRTPRKSQIPAETKCCKECKAVKPIAEFNLDGGGRRRSRCKPCYAAYRFALRPTQAERPRGSAHHAAKLTDDDVRLISSLIYEREELLAKAKRLTNRILAEKFDVHTSTIEKIANGKRWVA